MTVSDAPLFKFSTKPDNLLVSSVNLQTQRLPLCVLAASIVGCDLEEGCHSRLVRGLCSLILYLLIAVNLGSKLAMIKHPVSYLLHVSRVQKIR